MDIGIIGSGRMGSGLGRLWASKGHRVLFGSRDLAKAQALAAAVGASAQGGSDINATEFGAVLLLSVPWSAAEEVVKQLPLSGKVLIDCTNPIGPLGRLAVGHTTSAAEEIARWAPEARVVKAFNGIHFASLEQPHFGNQIADVFYCGDDAAAKAAVRQLIVDIGFEPVDCGPLERARLLEPLALLWIRLAFSEDLGANFAFKIVQ